MKQRKAKANPSLDLQQVTPSVWYYEERSGVIVCIEHPGGDIQARIPWSMLTKSMRRCVTKEAKRGKR